MSANAAPTVQISRIEYRSDSEFVATPRPRLTWRTETDVDGWTQAAAEIECDGVVERVEGRDSVLVQWPFPDLAADDRRIVRVRVHGADGSVSEWSAPRTVRAGFVGADGWTAELIGLSAPERRAQPALLRTEFTEDRTVASATLFAFAQGVYQVEINGQEVDDETLKPGWTSYQWHRIHETTDVTALVRTGPNAIGIELAGGWYAGNYGFGEDAAPFYGPQPTASLMLRLTFDDGSSRTIRSDGTWRGTGDGPIVEASNFGGQHDDDRRAVDGWSSPGFDDSAWGAVSAEAAPTPTPRSAPPVRRVAELPVASRSVDGEGRTVLDFGQNLTGRLRIAVDLPEGRKITVRHAEILTDGALNRGSMRGAAVTDSFTSAGRPVLWEPNYTFRGFRYVDIEGWDEIPSDAVTAVVVSSDLTRTGWFTSSNELVDKLHESTVWSMVDNFVSVPTDCPQRDERLGWTGDIQVFAPTAADLFDVDGFLANWLVDVALEQDALDGMVPYVVPNVSGVWTAPAAAWADAATVVPWELYRAYGDVEVLRAQYGSMKRWVDLVDGIAGERHLWLGGFQFGDWLDPTTPPDFPTDAKADAELVATAYFAYSTQLLAEAAAVLGEDADAEHYRSLADAIRAAFRDEYVTKGGRVASDAQTAYALPLAFDIADDDDLAARMGEHLRDLVRRGGYHIGTGFAGTSFILDALVRGGQVEAADRLLTQTEHPSWLYPITKGATTTWEAWDAIRPDGSVNPRDVSFNHYAFGAVVHWLHADLAGLSAAEPGYRVIRIAPVPLDSFDHAEVVHDTPYGRAESGWRRSGARGETLTVRAVIPPNTSAEVHLPGADEVLHVGSGTHVWDVTVPRPQERRQTLTLMSDQLDIIDDRQAYEAVLAVLDEYLPHAADAFRTHPIWKGGVPLQLEFFTAPAEVQAKIDERLAELSR